jgi:hypothetical protein
LKLYKCKRNSFLYAQFNYTSSPRPPAGEGSGVRACFPYETHTVDSRRTHPLLCLREKPDLPRLPSITRRGKWRARSPKRASYSVAPHVVGGSRGRGCAGKPRSGVLRDFHRRRIPHYLRTGWVEARPENDCIVKVKVEGLRPGVRYYYRVATAQRPTAMRRCGAKRTRSARSPTARTPARQASWSSRA